MQCFTGSHILWIRQYHAFTFRYFCTNEQKWSGQMYRSIRLCTKRHPYRFNSIWINHRGVWWKRTKSNASLTLVENGRRSWGTGVLDVVVCALHSVKSLLQVNPATSQYSHCILSRPVLQHSYSPDPGTWTAGGFFKSPMLYPIRKFNNE